MIAWVLVLTALGTVTVLFALKRVAWAISAGAVLTVLGGLALQEYARALPIEGQPPAPFVLVGAIGGYAWAVPEGATSPRTYVWQPPPDMLRDLHKGALQVEGKDKPAQEGSDRPWSNEGDFRWAPLEPDAVKP